MDKSELVKSVATTLGEEPAAVERILDAALEEIYQSMKRGEPVSLRNFGTFYIDERRSGTVFKFNPSQKWRKLFGWSSTYKGKL